MRQFTALFGKGTEMRYTARQLKTAKRKNIKEYIWLPYSNPSVTFWGKAADTARDEVFWERLKAKQGLQSDEQRDNNKVKAGWPGGFTADGFVWS